MNQRSPCRGIRQPRLASKKAPTLEEATDVVLADLLQKLRTAENHINALKRSLKILYEMQAADFNRAICCPCSFMHVSDAAMMTADQAPPKGDE